MYQLSLPVQATIRYVIQAKSPGCHWAVSLLLTWVDALKRVWLGSGKSVLSKCARRKPPPMLQIGILSALLVVQPRLLTLIRWWCARGGFSRNGEKKCKVGFISLYGVTYR